MGKYSPLILSGVASLVLLLVLGAMQAKDWAILKLEAHWLGIALLPVLVVLVAGGYLRRLHGFGIEIEAALREPVFRPDLIAEDLLEHQSGGMKESFEQIRPLSRDRKLALRRLGFRSGQENYYTDGAIAQYLDALPNLQVFELRTAEERLLAVADTAQFREPDGSYNWQLLHDFVHFVETGEQSRLLRTGRPKVAVRPDAALLDVLRKVRINGADFAAVEAADGRYLGLVFADDMEREIADAVLIAGAA
jgi:hypothetical protein